MENLDRGHITFSMLNSAEYEFILLINVKMPTNVGILTFMSTINTTFEGLKARNFFICRFFYFYGQLNFVLSFMVRQPHPKFRCGSRHIEVWFAWKTPNLSMYHLLEHINQDIKWR